MKKTSNSEIEITIDDKAKRNKIVDLTLAGLYFQLLRFLYTRVRGRKNVVDVAENTERELFKSEKIKRWDMSGTINRIAPAIKQRRASVSSETSSE